MYDFVTMFAVWIDFLVRGHCDPRMDPPHSDGGGGTSFTEHR